MISKDYWQGWAHEAIAAGGHWIQVNDMVHPPGVAIRIKDGRTAAFRPPASFEAVARKRNKIEQGKAVIYIRWVHPGGRPGRFRIPLSEELV